MRTFLPKRAVFLWLSLLTIAACAASRFTPVVFSRAATNTPTASAATYMPRPQAIPMGVLGKGSAEDIAWSPDGSLLAVGSSAGGYIYDTSTWEVRDTVPLDAFKTKTISNLAFSPHGKTLLFLSNAYDASLMRYDLQTRNITLPVENGNSTTRGMPVFSPDESLFTIQIEECEQNLGCSHTLEIHDTTTGNRKYQLLALLPGESNTITSILFSPSGEMIAVGTGEGEVLVWDASSGARRHVFQHDSAVSDLAFSADSSVLVSASQDATVRFWDTQSGKNLAILRGFTRPVQHAAFILNDQRLLVGQYDGTFLEWSLNQRHVPVTRLNVTLKTGAPIMRSGFDSGETVMEVNPAGDRMAFLVNSVIQVWDLKTGKPALTIPEYNAAITALAASPDQNLLAVGDANLHLWQMNPPKFVKTLVVNGGEIKDIAFRPTSSQVAVVTSDGDVQTWDVITGRKIREITGWKITGDRGAVAWCNNAQIAFTPDGSKLATAGNCGVRIWDAGTGKLQKILTEEPGEVYQLTFSAGSNQLVYVSASGISSLNILTGQRVYNQKLDEYFRAAAIQPTLMVLGMSYDGPYSFFDPLNGQHLYDFAGSSTTAVALSPDGRLFARSEYGNIMLADATSGKELLSVKFYLPYFINFSPDGKTLYASSYENTIHAWDISSLYTLLGTGPRHTATPFPTITPTPTITSVPISPLPVERRILPTPQPGAITAKNSHQLQVIGEVGLGNAKTAAWSADGKMLAIGGAPGVYVYRSGSSIPAQFLPANGIVLAVTFSPDGKLLAGKVEYSAIEVWNLATGRSLYKYTDLPCPADAPANPVFRPDGKTLSMVCYPSIYTWDMADGRLLSKERSKDDDARSKETFQIQMDNKNARLLEASTGQILKTFEQPDMTPGPYFISPDKKTLLIWYYQYEIAHSGVYLPGKDRKTAAQLWDIASLEEPILKATLSTGIWNWYLPFLEMFQSTYFTPDGRRVATASGDNQTQIWDAGSGKLLYMLPGADTFYFSPDGTQLASIDESGIVRVWDVTPGRKPVVTRTIEGFSDNGSFLSFTQDGKALVSASAQAFRTWEVSGGKLSKNFTQVDLLDDPPVIVATSPDGKYLAYRTSDNLIVGENNPSNPRWRMLEKYANPIPGYTISGLVFSPDSKLLASSNQEHKVHIWNLDSAEPVELSPDLPPSDLIFHSNGKWVLVDGGNGNVELWSVLTGDRLRQWDVKGDLVAYHPDGARLVSAKYATGAIYVWDIESGKLLRTLQGSQNARNMIASPDGSLLVSAGYTWMEFWDIESGRLLHKMDARIRSLAFSPDGKMLAAILADGRIRYWGVPVK